MADPPIPGGRQGQHSPGVTPPVALDSGFDALYGLEMVGPGLGEDGILRGRVQVRPELMGPADRLHGGVPAAIAESLASQGTALITIDQGLVPSGLSNDTTVIAAVDDGTTLHAEAAPLGRVEDHWVWSVQLRDEAGALCAFSRVTIAVRPLRR